MVHNTTLENRLASFPIGYYELHPDISVNYQMNRFYNWVGEKEMVTEMRAAAAGVQEYPCIGYLGHPFGK